MTHADSSPSESNADVGGVQPPAPDAGPPTRVDPVPGSPEPVLPPARGSHIGNGMPSVPPPPPRAQGPDVAAPPLRADVKTTPPKKVQPAVGNQDESNPAPIGVGRAPANVAAGSTAGVQPAAPAVPQPRQAVGPTAPSVPPPELKTQPNTADADRTRSSISDQRPSPDAGQRAVSGTRSPDVAPPAQPRPVTTSTTNSKNPQQGLSLEKPAGAAGPENRAASSAPRNPNGLPVPPPPPPRSTLPPVRQPVEVTPQSKVATGVGTAKGVRWRGELDGVGKPAGSKKPQPLPVALGEVDIPEGDSEDPTARDQVTREAPSWLVSMVIHLILLLILAFISTPAGTKIGTLMLSIGQSIQDSPVDFAEFEIATTDIPNDSQVMEEVESEVNLDSLFESADVETVEDVVPVEIGMGAMELAQPMFNGRSGAIKAALLARFGGTPKTQDAVKRGLEWLKRNQKSDGSWSMQGPYNDGGFTENKIAATAMALLAYLGDGHTHKKGHYQKVVERGMKWLVKQQDRQGFFAKNARSHEKMYAQAQASIAICELYGMSGDSWLRPHAQRAIDFAEKAQSERGGWRYEPKYDSDTSMTGWYVMALESGRAAKLDVNISVLTRVMLYLDEAASYDGAAYGYQAGSAPSSAMTAEGLLCRQYIGWERDHPPMVRGISALIEDAPFNIADQDVYYWYYATQVLHHYGGSPWRRWNTVMREELPNAQVKTGKESGSWAPQRDRWGKNAGRLYTTCLSLYCLEVYYRHMPIYDVAAPPPGE